MAASGVHWGNLLKTRKNSVEPGRTRWIWEFIFSVVYRVLPGGCAAGGRLQATLGYFSVLNRTGYRILQKVAFGYWVGGVWFSDEG